MNFEAHPWLPTSRLRQRHCLEALRHVSGAWNVKLRALLNLPVVLKNVRADFFSRKGHLKKAHNRPITPLVAHQYWSFTCA